MRTAMIAFTMMAGMTTTAALAQTSQDGVRPGHVPGVGTSLPLSNNASNIDRADTRSHIAPTLPTANLGPSAGPKDYLQAARNELAAGKTGATQQSLEMAETRALDRSTEQGATGVPSGSPMVATIRDALQAVGHGDKTRAMKIIDQALAQG